MSLMGVQKHIDGAGLAHPVLLLGGWVIKQGVCVAGGCSKQAHTGIWLTS